jgi:ABC-2 type transport system ATP-binding protein
VNAIEVAGLTKNFGAVRALDGLDLTIPSGTVSALLGPNGVGKTTVIRILATLIRPDAGRALVSGYDVVTQPALVRARIGLAGQYAAVDDDLTGRENLVILGLMLHLGRRAARRRADSLLTEAGLADAADRLVKTWSGGMRRRLDLTASLITVPTVLFLDEPTSGVDPRSRAAIWSSVRELAAAGSTVLLATQYLDEADRLADDVVIIDAGRIVARDTPEALKDTLGTRIEVVVETASDLPAAASAAARWATRPPVVDADQRRLTIAVASGSVSLPALVRELDAVGVAALDVSIRRPTLDEVFLDRTAGTARPPGDAQAANTAGAAA